MITILLKASIISAVLLAFYKIFLEKESFFATNRAFLISCLILIFTIPFVTLPQLVSDQGFVSTWMEDNLTEDIPTSKKVELANESLISKAEQRNTSSDTSTGPDAIISQETETALAPAQSPQPVQQKHGLTYWIFWIYIFGVLVFSLNFITQIISILLKVIKTEDKIEDLDCTIINSSKVTEPCSFFNYIFINPESYDYDTYEQILVHERIHVNKRHTFDLLFSEIAVIALWFNPIVWFFRKEIEKNIEYQTDDFLVNGDAIKVEKEQYQMNLLKVATYSKPLTITTNYNQSLIKQRILRMAAKKSNAHSFWKYAFIIPLLFMLLLVINKPKTALAQTSQKEPVTVLDNKLVEESNKLDSTSTELPKSIAAQPNHAKQQDKKERFDKLDKEEQQDILNTFRTSGKITDIAAFNMLDDSTKLELLKSLKALGDIEALEMEDLDFEIEYHDVPGIENSIVLVQFDDLTLEERLEAFKAREQFENLPESKRIEVYHIFVKYGNLENPDVLKVLSGKKGLKDFENEGYTSSPGTKVKKGHNRTSDEMIKEAIENDDLAIVNDFISTGSNINLVIPHVGTPLIVAASEGNLDMVKLLIDAGADVNIKAQHVGSPLTKAAANDNLAVVKYLIAKGAIVDLSVPHVGTPLILAAANGNFDIVKYLISQNSNIEKSVQHVGTPLIRAAGNGELEIVKYLLSQGASIDQEVQHVGTALIVSVGNGELNMMKHLLTKGADINKEVQHVGTPLIKASRNGDIKTVKYLLEQGANIEKWVEHVGNPMSVAVQENHKKMVEFLLSQGAAKGANQK